MHYADIQKILRRGDVFYGLKDAVEKIWAQVCRRGYVRKRNVLSIIFLYKFTCRKYCRQVSFIFATVFFFIPRNQEAYQFCQIALLKKRFADSAQLVRISKNFEYYFYIIYVLR